MPRCRNELAALVYYRVAMFKLGEGKGSEHAALVTAALPIVRRAALTLKRAFIARIETCADLTVLLEGGKRLERPRRMQRLKHER